MLPSGAIDHVPLTKEIGVAETILVNVHAALQREGDKKDLRQCQSVPVKIFKGFARTIQRYKKLF